MGESGNKYESMGFVQLARTLPDSMLGTLWMGGDNARDRREAEEAAGAEDDPRYQALMRRVRDRATRHADQLRRPARRSDYVTALLVEMNMLHGQALTEDANREYAAFRGFVAPVPPTDALRRRAYYDALRVVLDGADIALAPDIALLLDTAADVLGILPQWKAATR